jgi:hypothetical protein
MPPAAPLATDSERADALEAACAFLGLSFDAEWQAEILANMKVIAGAARMVAEFPLEDEIEPAPIFSP